MAAGQGAFTVAADVAALDALGNQLQVQEAERGALHVRQLRTLLRLQAVDAAAGMSISTVANAALLLGASENRTTRLLSEALLLGALPGGLEAVECGLPTVEQSDAVVRQLSPLPFSARLRVWERLQALLLAEAQSSVLPPPRLTELLSRWVMEADAADAEQRRRTAEQDRRLDHRRRQDGLGDLFAFGFTAPDLQAVLSRVRARSGPSARATSGQPTSAGSTPSRICCSAATRCPWTTRTTRRRLPYRAVPRPAGAAPPAAAGRVRPRRAEPRCSCTSRTVPHSVRPMRWQSSSATGRSSPTCCSRCCSRPRGCGSCGPTSTACRSPSATRRACRSGTTRRRYAGCCSTS